MNTKIQNWKGNARLILFDEYEPLGHEHSEKEDSMLFVYRLKEHKVVRVVYIDDNDKLDIIPPHGYSRGIGYVYADTPQEINALLDALAA